MPLPAQIARPGQGPPGKGLHIAAGGGSVFAADVVATVVSPATVAGITGTVTYGGLLYGSGLDGDCDITTSLFNYSSAFAGDTLIANNVLQRDASFASLTIEPGQSLNTNGFILQVQKLFLNLGTLSNDGANAAGATGGASSGQGTTAQGSVAGATGLLTAIAAPLTRWGYGGPGGSGGGNVPTNPSQTVFGPGPGDPIYLLSNLYRGQFPGYYGNAGGVISGVIGGFWPGGGGGGGGSLDGVNPGGGGGGGGGFVVVFAQTIDNSSGTIQANGGNAANGTGGNSHGGGPGGGGVIVLAFDAIGVQLGTISTAAGAIGLHAGTGSDGSPGTNGNVFLFPGAVQQTTLITTPPR